MFRPLPTQCNRYDFEGRTRCVRELGHEGSCQRAAHPVELAEVLFPGHRLTDLSEDAKHDVMALRQRQQQT